MPNNNKIAISRGYAIKTADLSIYDRGQSEFVVEKNTVVVSSKSDMSKINYYGTMNFQDDRPISPRVNRTTLAGGIITNGLRSGATVPANTPSINKSRDYILTNRSNTAMRDGEYNFTTGKFNSDFPQVVVDRPAFDATLFGSAITIFLAGTALLANTDNEGGDGEGRDDVAVGGGGGGHEENPPVEDGGDVDPDDPNGDGSKPKCSEQESPSSEHNPNAGCCIQYTRTKPIGIPHDESGEDGNPDTEVWTHECYRRADCSECPNPINLNETGECEIIVEFSTPKLGDDLNHFLEFCRIVFQIPREKIKDRNRDTKRDNPALARKHMKAWNYSYKFSCADDASCKDSYEKIVSQFPLVSKTPPYNPIVWPTVPQNGYNPAQIVVERRWRKKFTKPAPGGTNIDQYQTYNVWSQADCNTNPLCGDSPTLSYSLPDACGICAIYELTTMIDVCDGLDNLSKPACFDCAYALEEALRSLNAVIPATQEECEDLSCYFPAIWTPGIIIDDECRTAH